MSISKKGAALGYVLVTGLLLILIAAVMVSTVGGVTKASLHSADKKLSYIDVKSSIEYAKAVINARLDADSHDLETDFYVTGNLSNGVLSFQHHKGRAPANKKDVYARAEFEDRILQIRASGSRLNYWDEALNVHYEYKLGPGAVLSEIPVGYAQVSRHIGGDDIMRQSNTNNVMPVIFKYTLNLNFGNYTFNVLKTYFMGDILGELNADPVALIASNSYSINSNVLYFRGEIRQLSNVSLNIGRFNSSYTPDYYPTGRTLYFYFDNVRIVYRNGTKSSLLNGVYFYTLSSNSSTVNMFDTRFPSWLTLLGVPDPPVMPEDPGLTPPTHPGLTEPTSVSKPSFPSSLYQRRLLSTTYYAPPQNSGESDSNYLTRLDNYRNGTSYNGYRYSNLNTSQKNDYNNYHSQFRAYVEYQNALAAYNAQMAPYWNELAAYDSIMGPYFAELADYTANLNAYNNTNKTTLDTGLKHFDSHVIESRPDIRQRWISAEDAGWLTNGLISTGSPAAKPDNYISMYLIGLNYSSNHNTFKNYASLHYQARTVRLRTYLDVGGTTEYDILVGRDKGQTYNSSSTAGHWYYAGGGGTGRYTFGNGRSSYTSKFDPVSVKFTTQFICFENYDRILQMHPNSSFRIAPAVAGKSIYVQFNQDTYIYLSNGSIKTIRSGVYEIDGEIDLFDGELHTAAGSGRFTRVADITSTEVITPGLIPTVSVEDGRYVR